MGRSGMGAGAGIGSGNGECPYARFGLANPNHLPDLAIRQERETERLTGITDVN